MTSQVIRTAIRSATRQVIVPVETRWRELATESRESWRGRLLIETGETAALGKYKARHLEHLRRNQDGVAQQKATFAVAYLQAQETQNTLEAVEIRPKPAISDQTASSTAGASITDAVHKPV